MPNNFSKYDTICVLNKENINGKKYEHKKTLERNKELSYYYLNIQSGTLRLFRVYIV